MTRKFSNDFFAKSVNQMQLQFANIRGDSTHSSYTSIQIFQLYKFYVNFDSDS